MTEWTTGPVPKKHADRLTLARDLAERARLRFQAVAVGAYGSLARGDDGPFSDIEMMCIVDDDHDTTLEWVHDGWKIEVNVLGREQVLQDAATVTGDWSITHANYLTVLPFHDRDGFFPAVAQRVASTPQSAFDRAIERLFVDELYEAIAKVRNAREAGRPPAPGFVFYVAKIGCWLAGLANRRTYATATRALSESLGFPIQIDGYDQLCRLALSHDVTDSESAFAACEAFWRGAATWAAARRLTVESPAHLV